MRETPALPTRYPLIVTVDTLIPGVFTLGSVLPFERTELLDNNTQTRRSTRPGGTFSLCPSQSTSAAEGRLPVSCHG